MRGRGGAGPEGGAGGEGGGEMASKGRGGGGGAHVTFSFIEDSMEPKVSVTTAKISSSGGSATVGEGGEATGSSGGGSIIWLTNLAIGIMGGNGRKRGWNGVSNLVLRVMWCQVGGGSSRVVSDSRNIKTLFQG